MTAIVGVLNKHAVAIAADSAVTLGGGKKVMNVANKLFALSKHHPVAISIYGNAEFIGTPWETIIKEYRKKLGDKSFPHLKGYVDNFIKFLKDKNYYCTDKEADEDTAASILVMNDYFYSLCFDNNQTVAVVDSEYEKDVEERIRNAQSSDEISDIISDVLVKSLTDQLNM